MNQEPQLKEKMHWEKFLEHGSKQAFLRIEDLHNNNPLAGKEVYIWGVGETGLTMWSKLAWSSQSSCLSLESAGITRVHPNGQL
jgi:hypothetical protein